MRKIPLLRKNTMNTYVVRVMEEGDRLDYLNFKENKGTVVICDSSGYDLPLNRLIYESPEGASRVQAVRKSKLSQKMCIILGETENFFIIKEIK